MFTQTGFRPYPPTNLLSTIINDSSIILSWNASVSEYGDVEKYEVHKDGLIYGSTTTTNLAIKGLVTNTNYSITVKAVYFGNSSASSTELIVNIPLFTTPKIILSENFDGFKDGNPGPLVSGIDISTSLDSYTQNVGWTGYRNYQAGGTIKVGASTTLGFITTPAIDLSLNSGKFNLSFQSMAWKGDSTNFKIYLNDKLVHTTIGLKNDSTYTLSSYSVDLVGGTTSSKIKFEGSASLRGRFFLNNLLITQGKIILPNLHVSTIVAQNMTSGSKTTVEWTVKNDGIRSTQKNNWRDKIWLVPDITKDFASTGYLLTDVQNLDSLVSGNSYHNSTQVTIPERLYGTYYLVVTSDMNNIASIDWHPAGDTIPNPYIPNVSGIPYYYLKAKTGTYLNSVYEDDETSDVSDNFNYQKIEIALPPLPDLQVTSVLLPDQIIADRKVSLNATIANKGKVDISGKSWIDRIYLSKDVVFNKVNATLLGSLIHNNGLKKDSSYVANLQFTAPADTLNSNRFFVETDVLDSVFESVQDNNITASNWVKLLPNTINYYDYQALCNFFSTTSGFNWTTNWNVSSNRISSINWPGVSFEEGYVTAVSLPSNQLAGDFPLILFTLPKIKQINLYDNQLTEKIKSTIINLTLLNSLQAENLTSLNLGKNLLKGEVPSLISILPRLQYLNLENNKLSSIKTPLPLHITNLNIQNQSIEVDSIKLSVTPELILPSLCTYNHSSQSFDDHPYYSLQANGNNIGSMNYSADKYHLNWINPLGWMFLSGQPLVLRQETGAGVGSTSTFKLFYKSGDANVDQQVDILDVQHSLNNLLGDNPQPFNFSAADTYLDNIITVQDIVKTVNFVLSSVIDPVSTAIQKSKSTVQSPNRLYIENNQLVLNAEQPVSAMDISLQGISDKQLRLMLISSKFQLIARNLSEGGTRFIVFSPTGAEIPTGKTIIAELYSENVGVSSAQLSDKGARIVSVSLNNSEVTGWGNLSDLHFSVYTVSHKAIVVLPSAVQILHATLYSAQGVLLDDRIFKDLPSGKFTIDYSAFTNKSGVYLLKLSATRNNEVNIVNSKLIISK